MKPQLTRRERKALRKPSQTHPRKTFLGDLQEIQNRATEAADEILGTGDTIATTADVARNAQDTVGRFEAEARKNPRRACKAGCFWCCSLRVSVNAPEVFRIAAVIADTFSPQEIRALQLRTAAYHATVGGLRGKEQTGNRTFCPLLVDGECSVYEARPLACRGWNSFDERVCQQDFENPTSENPITCDLLLLQSSAFAREGTAQAIQAAGLDDATVDLGLALSIALDGNLGEIHRRWRAGERVFEAAEYSQETQDDIARMRLLSA